MSKEQEFDFYKDVKESNEIDDLIDRKHYWQKKIKEFKQAKNQAGYDDIFFWSSKYDRQVEEEINFIKTQIKDDKKNNLKKSNSQPIWWKKSARLLRYLMEELAKHDFIENESPINKHIKEHFIDKNKDMFSDSIKQNSSGVGNNKTGKPKGHEKIDDIITQLKNQKE